MAKKTVTCDVCGIEMNYADSMWVVGGERDLCQVHYREHQIQDAKRDRATLQYWLDAHLKKIGDLDAKIAELEANQP